MENLSDKIELITDLNRSYGLELAETLTLEEMETLIAEQLNEWIRTDMNALLLFLYRVDINESRLRQLLKESGEDAGRIMARMVLQRLWQKIQTRRLYKGGGPSSDEERW